MSTHTLKSVTFLALISVITAVAAQEFDPPPPAPGPPPMLPEYYLARPFYKQVESKCRSIIKGQLLESKISGTVKESVYIRVCKCSETRLMKDAQVYLFFTLSQNGLDDTLKSESQRLYSDSRIAEHTFGCLADDMIMGPQ